MRWLASERAMVSPVAGTTRDAVDETIEHEGVEYSISSNAGIRRKGKTNEMPGKAECGDGAAAYPDGQRCS